MSKADKQSADDVVETDSAVVEESTDAEGTVAEGTVADGTDATDTTDAAPAKDRSATDKPKDQSAKKKSKAQTKAEREAAEHERAVRRRTPQPVKLDAGKNPRWWVPTMLGLMLLGLAWLVVTSLSTGAHKWPVPALGQWNLAVGFVLIMAGFVMTTRWK